MPTVSNATRTLQVKEDGSGYEFTDFVKGINNTGMHLLSRQHKTSAQSSSGWIFNITNYEDYDYFKLVGVNIRCSVNGALVWRGIKASDNTENMTNSEYSYIFSNIGSTGTGSNAGSNPGVNLTGSHLIADSTPGPVNFEVTIYGLNKSEQKYSTFHSSGQTSSTEYDNNTSYYYTGSTLQYGSSSSEDYKCNGIKIYNNNSSNNFYGTIMLYGFRNNSNVVSTINYNGSELLDNKIIDTNSQNLILDCGSAYESYEYFELVCTNIQGTVNGYIGWQPYTSNPITTSTSTKWKTFTITDNTPDVTTNESKQWHILGFTTQGKQQIRSQIYNLNKVDKKYCKFNNIGLHSNTTDTISQEGSTSQIDNTKCRYIVINNFAEADTTNATGYISAGTIMLYGYKTNKSAAMTVPIPNPTFEDAGKVLQLDSTGTTIEYADKSIHNSIVDGDMIIGNDNDNIMIVNSKSEFNQEIKGNLRGDVVGKFEGEINNGKLKGTTVIGEDKDDLVIVNGDTKLLGNVNIGNNNFNLIIGGEGNTISTYSSTHGTVSMPSGTISITSPSILNGMQLRTNWTRDAPGGFRDGAPHQLFDGSLDIETGSYEPIDDNTGPTVDSSNNDEYSSGHYVWVDIKLPNPLIIDNIKVWARSDGVAFPEKFIFEGGQQWGTSTMTTDGNYVQPDSNDTNWTQLGDIFNGSSINPGSTTPTSTNYTYTSRYILDNTLYSYIRFKVLKGASDYIYQDFVVGEIQIQGRTNKGNEFNIGNNTEIKGNINITNNIKLNSTPLITQIHGFYQSATNNMNGQWLNHAVTLDAHVNNSVRGMKSVVNMMPYALTFTSDTDTGVTETNFTFEIRARNDTSSDAALDTSNTTNRGTITLNNLTTNKGEMGLINNPSQISTNQNWGLYINSAVLSSNNTTNTSYYSEFLVKVYFYQV